MTACGTATDNEGETVAAAIDVSGAVATINEAAALVLLEQERTAQCMDAQGFTFNVDKLSDLRRFLVGDSRLTDLTFGTDDPAAFFASVSAVEQAYQSYSSPNNDLLSRLSAPEQEGWYQALQGDGLSDQVEVELPDGSVAGAPSAGCLAEARESIYGSTDDYLQLSSLPSNFRQLVMLATNNRPEVIRATEAWQECVSPQGYKYDSPSDLALAVAQTAGGAPSAAKAAELATSCSVETDLTSIGWTAVGEELDKAMESLQPTIDSYRAVIDDQLG